MIATVEQTQQPAEPIATPAALELELNWHGKPTKIFWENKMGQMLSLKHSRDIVYDEAEKVYQGVSVQHGRVHDFVAIPGFVDVEVEWRTKDSKSKSATTDVSQLIKMITTLMYRACLIESQNSRHIRRFSLNIVDCNEDKMIVKIRNSEEAR